VIRLLKCRAILRRCSAGGEDCPGRPQVFLKPDIAQPIALILHELATNAAKYGALSAAEGRIDLKWSHGADGWLILCRTEMGGPEIQTPSRQPSGWGYCSRDGHDKQG
jgi:two-component sensor histidine kinase